MDPGRLLTLEEARTLVAYLGAQRSRTSAQAWIIVRLGLEAGLRVSEIVRLRIEDCHTARLLLYVRESKRGKSRAVRITAELAEALRYYVERCRPASEAPELLVSVRTGQPVTTRAVELMFQTALRAAGFPEHRRRILGPHSMRHTYATRSLERGKSLAWVRNQLGHSNVSTTDVYLQVADLETEAAVELY